MIQVGDIIKRRGQRNLKYHCAKVVGETDTAYQVHFWNMGFQLGKTSFPQGFSPFGGTIEIPKSEAVKVSEEDFLSFPAE